MKFYHIVTNHADGSKADLDGLSFEDLKNVIKTIPNLDFPVTVTIADSELFN